MSKKKRRILVGIAYTLFLCLWAGLLCYGANYALGRAWEYAEEYEASRPTRTMDEYVEGLRETLWDEGIAETVRAMPHEMQSDEEVAEHVREMLSGGISYIRKGGGGEGRALYSLRCGGNEFGTVSIVERDDYVGAIDTEQLPWSLLPWSIKPWRVESESFDFTGLYSSVEIVIPRSYSVWLNGKMLGSEYIVQERIPYDVLWDYYERYDGLPSKVKYRFDNVIGTLTPDIRNEEGESVRIDPTRDDSQFIRPANEAELERLGRFTESFLDRYLTYTSGVIDPQYGYQRLAPYLLPGSDLDGRMKDAMDGLSWAHTTSVNVDAAVLNGALALGEGFYICDMSSVATTFTEGKGQTENVSSMRVLIRIRNDDARAISLELT